MDEKDGISSSSLVYYIFVSTEICNVVNVLINIIYTYAHTVIHYTMMNMNQISKLNLKLSDSEIYRLNQHNKLNKSF